MSRFFKTKLATHQTVINVLKLTMIDCISDNCIELRFCNNTPEFLNYNSTKDMLSEFEELYQACKEC